MTLAGMKLKLLGIKRVVKIVLVQIVVAGGPVHNFPYIDDLDQTTWPNGGFQELQIIS